ncbi:T9SS type A sorting domain-containing protein [Lewinella sp. JB7]|uniref:T9SS type A sorting domain-containing protein n=1 Tax=Lewinella sp. JB7 TaxID=2962887 RepID=UPI0020C9B1B5|nr:T9SS type A sorting domain-containing protein [Lewinella sp. JB7]MCP9237310.1 T9SS type A sorting domain-containing protein [Lewinella sp. JB7]
MRYLSFIFLIAGTLATSSYTQAQTLVEDDNVPGVLVPEGYDLQLAITGLNYPSSITVGEGRYWITESGFDPQLPPTVMEITLSVGDTGVATAILSPDMLPMGTLAPPFTDVEYHKGMLYLAHRQKGVNDWLVGAYSRFSPDDPVNTFETIITNLPSVGDHSNNTIVFSPDGRAYFSQGSATNSSVVGADNADWVADAPMFSEIPAVDVTLNGTSFTARAPSPVDPDSNAVTAPYQPFDSGDVESGFVVPAATPENPVNGIIAGSGTVYSFDPDAEDSAATLRLEAWGLRNPFGLAFDATDSTRLFISNNGSDIRGRAGDPADPFDPSTFVIVGNRPIAQDADEMFELRTGGEVEFFGWPEFFHDPETNEPRGAADMMFCNSPALSEEDCPGYIFTESFRNSLTVENAFASIGQYVSVTGFTAAKTDTFGYDGDLFVTESGSFGPQTGAFSFTGYKVTRVDSRTGETFDFVVNQGDDADALFVPEKLNKPLSTVFIGEQLAIVDLGVAEPGINVFQAGTGKVWLLGRSVTTPTVDLQRDFGVSLSGIVPNPAFGRSAVHLTLRERIDADVTVHDLTGRLVRTVYSGVLAGGQHRLTFDVASLPNGPYIVRLMSQGGVVSRRFIVSGR